MYMVIQKAATSGNLKSHKLCWAMEIYFTIKVIIRTRLLLSLEQLVY